MTTWRLSRTMGLARLLPGILLSLTVLSPSVCAGADTAAGTTVGVTDLERLLQQLEDPQQREQLIKTLETLLIATRQDLAEPTTPTIPGLLGEQPQSLFFAYGELTERLAIAGRNLAEGLVMLPVTLRQLLEHLLVLLTPEMLTSIGVSLGALLILGILLRLLARRWEAKLRRYVAGREVRRPWRGMTWALLTIALSIMPYIALLAASAIVFSLFPVGPVLSGLVALAITTLLFYRLAYALALCLFDPESPSQRLLPLDDDTSRFAWAWTRRLISLSAFYYFITRTLLTSGITEEVYVLVRGVAIVIIALTLSLLVLRLVQRQRLQTADAADTGPRGFWGPILARLQHVWPIIALAYIWCVTFLALASFQYGVMYMVTAFIQMVTVTGLCLLLVWGGNIFYERALALNGRLGQYVPGLEVQTRRYLKIAWWISQQVILLGAILLILHAWGIPVSRLFTSPVVSDLLARLVILLLTVAVVALVVDFSTYASRKLIEAGDSGVEMSKQRKTLIPLLGTVVKYAALGIGGLVVLQQVGVNITPILAGVGIISLAVGFGAQTLVKDIINGLFILFEDSISVGDVVVIKGTGGLVEAVNLRTIRLRDLHGSVHVIPNSQVESITNMTKDYSFYVLDVSVAYREDTDQVVATLRDIDEGLRQDPAYAADMLEPIDIMGVERFADSAVIIRARLKTKPIRQWYVGREFNRRMKRVFDERGIEIPFPHRTLYWGQPKRGETPPLPISVRHLEALTKTTAEVDRRAVAAKSDVPGAH